MKNFILFKTLFVISSLFITSCEKEEAPAPKQQCEISNTGTIKIINKTPYSITVKIDGATPSNMGYMGPDDEATHEVTAGMNHTIKINTVSGSSQNISWDNIASVGTCKTSAINITL